MGGGGVVCTCDERKMSDGHNIRLSARVRMKMIIDSLTVRKVAQPKV